MRLINFPGYHGTFQQVGGNLQVFSPGNVSAGLAPRPLPVLPVNNRKPRASQSDIPHQAGPVSNSISAIVNNYYK